MSEISEKDIIAELMATDGLTDGFNRLADASKQALGSHNLHHFNDKPDTDLGIWLYVRAELHAFLCTKNKDYAKHRKLLEKSAMPLLALVTGTIMGRFGLPYASATALAAAIVLIPMKIGVSAWCKKFMASQLALTRDEANVVDGLYTDLNTRAR